MFKLAIVAALFGLIAAAPSAPAEAVVSHHGEEHSGVVAQQAQPQAAVPAVKPVEPVIEAKSGLQQEQPQQDQPIAQGGAEPSKEHAAQPLVQAAVEAEPQPAAAAVQAPAAGVPVGKQILFEVPLLKTPASTAKLAPIAAPIAQLAPITYAAPTFLAPLTAWNGLTALPASYSIDQYGYQITY